MSDAIAFPAEPIPTDVKPLEKGIAVCLSGGGYRAMLFHLGALWRLAELGYLGTSPRTDSDGNDLGRLERISSVSGGSITAGAAGLHWSKLRVDDPDAGTRFEQFVVVPIRKMADHTIVNLWKGLRTLLLPGSFNDLVIKEYRKHLYGEATLQALPDDPRFVINATNLQSGALWRFMKPYIRDWRVGENNNKKVSLAQAVAASSAFPPFLSPARFEFHESDYTPNSGGPGHYNLQRPPFTTKPVLSDGGVYDNLGLETAFKRFKTILVSDGGGQMQPQEKVPTGWGRQSYRVLSVIDNQVRSLRRRSLISAYKAGAREGAYWGIRTDISNYPLAKALPCPHDHTLKLADTPTDLSKKSARQQEQLINWGYAVCDAAMRSHVDRNLPAPTGFPYPAAAVG